MVKGRAAYRHLEKSKCQEALLEMRMVEWLLATTHLMAKRILCHLKLTADTVSLEPEVSGWPKLYSQANVCGSKDTGSSGTLPDRCSLIPSKGIQVSLSASIAASLLSPLRRHSLIFMKHHGKGDLGREGFIWLIYPESQSIMPLVSTA